jgi:hypothetical protein
LVNFTESVTGATISKVINRGMATAVAGFFALGMEMVADEFDGGYEAVAISLSVMVVGEFLRSYSSLKVITLRLVTEL